MDFGRMEQSELDKLDLTLPPEPGANSGILNGNPAKDPKIYIGCAKWGIKEWVGDIYPFKTKEKDFLDHYVKHYNSIELNATHYKVYEEETINKWIDKAGKSDFIFCPKMFKGVTHSGGLSDKGPLTNEFLKSISFFKDHLGPVFIQVSESFSPNRRDELFSYLASLPKEIQFFLELRHPGWFNNDAVKTNLFLTLRELNIGAVITDSCGRRDCVHMHLTPPKTFIRFVGNDLHATDNKRIDDWMLKIKYWLDMGLEELYFFMHMHEEKYSPRLTGYLIDQLNAGCGLSLLKPTFIPGQNELF